MIEKRPCTVEDIVEITGISKAEVNKYIDILEKEKKTLMGLIYQTFSMILLKQHREQE